MLGSPEARPEAHPNLLRDLVRYFAQLVFLASKFPDDIGVDLPWQPAFTSASFGAVISGALPAQPPVALASIPYERTAVLFNIAAMNATLGANEDTSSAEGTKRAVAYFQTAAGVFEHLRDAVVPEIRTPIGTPDPCSPEYSPAALQALRHLCLAQAQECTWQKAVSGASDQPGRPL